jgi:hypothetical protein
MVIKSNQWSTDMKWEDEWSILPREEKLRSPGFVKYKILHKITPENFKLNMTSYRLTLENPFLWQIRFWSKANL